MFDRMEKFNILSNRTSKRYRLYSALPYNYVPVTLEIHPTNKCNSSCKFCAFSNLNSLYSKELSQKRFINLMDEIVKLNVKSVVFAGGGEPALYPLICDGIDYLVLNGVDVGITTNGLFMNNKISNSLRKCSWVRFSLLTSNESDYEILTGNPQNYFKKICDNIKFFTSSFDKKTSCIPSASYMTGVKFDSIDRLYDFILLSKSLNLSQIFIKPIVSKFRKPSSSKNSFYIDSKEKIIEFANSNCIVTNLNKFLSQEQSTFMRKSVGESCSVIDKNLIGLITANGDYYPCLRQYVKYGISYGNIEDFSLKKLINSGKRKEIQNKECDFCRHWSLRSEIYKFEKTNKIEKCCDPHYNFL